MPKTGVFRYIPVNIPICHIIFDIPKFLFKMILLENIFSSKIVFIDP